MRYLQLLAVLLLATVWAASAQEDHQSPTRAQGYPSASQTVPANAGGEQSVQGCLSGSDGNYTLMAKNGTHYKLTGDTAKLAEHIGHEMKITGTVSSASTSPNNDSSAGTTASSGGEIQVTSFKHISKTCQSGMSH
ncbi:MAG: hypothetical protein WB566_15265 [Terriglobales bacterium]